MCLRAFACAETFSPLLVAVNGAAHICGKPTQRAPGARTHRYGQGVRWERLFADLESELASRHGAEQAAETAERSRFELGEVRLADRLAGAERPVRVQVCGGGAYTGRVRAVGDGWCVLAEEAVTLVPLTAVTSVEGLGRVARLPVVDGVTRRLTLAAALRRIARDRSSVRLQLTDGRQLTGTLDAVAADHVELSEHGPDDARRPGAVQRVRCVPFAALAAVTALGPWSLA